VDQEPPSQAGQPESSQLCSKNEGQREPIIERDFVIDLRYNDGIHRIGVAHRYVGHDVHQYMFFYIPWTGIEGEFNSPIIGQG
jgi:hypothetical protein